MMDMPYSWETMDSWYSEPIVKPNIRTGEGRMKIRGLDKHKDQKKKARRKMSKKSRRANRR